ncbi:MAG TPA: hypothetical protein VGP63_23235, partial [Planctomycetaceae bacterium]|nr:hypothetical protein [Planctomycetaceae bacterium]
LQSRKLLQVQIAFLFCRRMAVETKLCHQRPNLAPVVRSDRLERPVIGVNPLVRASGETV